MRRKSLAQIIIRLNLRLSNTICHWKVAANVPYTMLFDFETIRIICCNATQTSYGGADSSCPHTNSYEPAHSACMERGRGQTRRLVEYMDCRMGRTRADDG